ncbi:hypothetical protein BDV96DRAFT_642011 [Lophiotrema nucula]|uniref:Uncharacterized protein n=1 Tax=Lophiotrema nucula TaxID=690887 RepID=A0A6A5ZKP3_9PLEO|nr:hypothetical protein BDV96DRAFT_642011 [Lophiotrema nucula]
MASISTAYLALTVLALLSSQTAADYIPHLSLRANNTTANSTQCRTNDTYTYSHVNATSTFAVPGFQPPGFTPRNWTITTGLRDNRNATGNSSSDHLIMWIDSTDASEDLFSEDLPYFGCMIQMIPRKLKKSKGDIQTKDVNGVDVGQNGCQGIFSDKCYNAVLDFAQRSAQSASGFDKPSGRVSSVCATMLEFIEDSCDKNDGWDYAGTTPNLFGNGTSDCSTPGVAEGSIVRSDFPFTQADDRSNYDNYTTYEKYATTAMPFMLVAFLKNTTENAKSDPWGDARLLCPMPNQIAPGSREVKSSGVRLGSPWVASHLAVFVSCLLALLS